MKIFTDVEAPAAAPRTAYRLYRTQQGRRLYWTLDGTWSRTVDTLTKTFPASMDPALATKLVSGRSGIRFKSIQVDRDAH